MSVGDIIMLVKVDTIAFSGIETVGVCAEVNLNNRGIPSFDIVGLPDKTVDESKYRIKTAIINSGFRFPDSKITVNLAPADLHKEGAFYDVPIAVGILAASLNIKIPENTLFFGEISLDGSLKYTHGAFNLSLFAKEKNYKKIFIPLECINEASYVKYTDIYAEKNLEIMIKVISGKEKQKSIPIVKETPSLGSHSSKPEEENVFSQVLGQEEVKRVLEICASGGHNLIMIGPPGSGKTMIAKSIRSIIPHLNEYESIEVTKIYSALGKLASDSGLIKERPFRAPHHTTSYAGMLGGGKGPLPGEATLAHRGVLFMDEVNEFNRLVLESLRQPLEDGYISISRTKGSVTFPAKFMLIAAGNPCPCGNFGNPFKKCICTPKQISNYMKRLSGPILDRIDIHLNVKPVEISKLTVSPSEYDPNEIKRIRKNVEKVRLIQSNRFNCENIMTNAEMNNSHVYKYCRLSSDASELLNESLKKFKFSARTYFKIIKIAQTIADMAVGGDQSYINLEHIAEAIRYRTQLVT